MNGFLSCPPKPRRRRVATRALVLRSMCGGEPQFLRKVRCERREYFKESLTLACVPTCLIHHVEEGHHRCDRRIEFKRLDVIADFLYRLVQFPFCYFDCLLFALFCSLSQSPHALQKATRPYHALRAPCNRIS